MSDLNTMTKTQFIAEIESLRGRCDRAMELMDNVCPPPYLEIDGCPVGEDCNICRHEYVMKGEASNE
jgi:hypothetical protein